MLGIKCVEIGSIKTLVRTELDFYFVSFLSLKLEETQVSTMLSLCWYFTNYKAKMFSLFFISNQNAFFELII